MALKLTPRAVEKPWGREDLPACFPNPHCRRIGEIWFEDPRGTALPLLVKYLFTSERLSIQVHPDDSQAVLDGLRSGKEECWYIVDCEEGAVLGIGLTAPLLETEMRAAIADRSIEQLIDWKRVRPGDFFFIPAGTVHAVGAGITLVEVQQNADITYRLYDYGRPRELHLEKGLAAAHLAPYERDPVHLASSETRMLLPPGEGPFVLEMVPLKARRSFSLGQAAQSWFIPLTGEGCIDGEPFRPNECWLTDPQTKITGSGAGRALVAHLEGRLAE